MSENTKSYAEVSLPVLPLRGLVGFPGVQMNIEIARPSSLKSFTAAATLNDAKILLITQRDISVEDPTEKDLYKVGVYAEIKHVVKNPQGTLSVVFEGITRAKIASVYVDSGYLKADAILRKEQKLSVITPTIEALMHEVKNHLSSLKDLHPTFTEEMRLAAEAITEPGYLADFVASSAVIDYKNKQIGRASCRERVCLSV